MGLAMQSRGRQSWGWTNGSDVFKSMGELEKSFSPEVLGHDSGVLHTRYATCGAQVAENSHPFSIGGLIGVHNGMIYNHAEAAKRYAIDYKVDSEVIYQYIDRGFDLSELEGYGTLVFYRDGKMHIGRFNGGDFAIAKTDYGWLFCSTDAALKQALQMSGTRALYFPKLKQGYLYRLDGDHLTKLHEYLPVTERKNGQTWQSASGASVSGSYGNSSYYNGRTYYGNGVYGQPSTASKPTITGGATPTTDANTSKAIVVAAASVQPVQTKLPSVSLDLVKCVVCDHYFNAAHMEIHDMTTESGLCSNCYKRLEAEYERENYSADEIAKLLSAYVSDVVELADEGEYEEESIQSLDWDRYSVHDMFGSRGTDCEMCNAELAANEFLYWNEETKRAICSECRWEEYGMSFAKDVNFGNINAEIEEMYHLGDDFPSDCSIN